MYDITVGSGYPDFYKISFKSGYPDPVNEIETNTNCDLFSIAKSFNDITKMS